MMANSSLCPWPWEASRAASQKGPHSPEEAPIPKGRANVPDIYRVSVYWLTAIFHSTWLKSIGDLMKWKWNQYLIPMGKRYFHGLRSTANFPQFWRVIRGGPSQAHSQDTCNSFHSDLLHSYYVSGIMSPCLPQPHSILKWFVNWVLNTWHINC